jgi:hypothetical protein
MTQTLSINFKKKNSDSVTNFNQLMTQTQSINLKRTQTQSIN